MAEAILRDLAGSSFEVFSAGSKPSTLNPYAVEVMSELGIDISSHYSKHWQDLDDGKRFDFVISVCSEFEAECPIFHGDVGSRLRWVFNDPANCTDEKNCLELFRAIRDKILKSIKEWLKGNDAEEWK